VLALAARRIAIGGYDGLLVPHIGVMRRVENTAVGRQAREYQGGCAQVPQQDIKRGLIKN
jgi:hypothetical protein